MKRIYIVNEKSGKNKALNVMKQIKEVCDEEKLDYEIISTKSKLDATNITKHYDDLNNVIFSVGGDGTLNEVVNGIDKSKLGIIPVGTGNDFYRSVSNTTDKIDLGKVNDRYFINTAALGIDAYVADVANTYKDKGYNNAYIRGIIKALKEYKNIVLNNEEILLLTICNGKYYGNGFNIAPFAKINDGYLDLCRVNDINILKLASLLLKLTKATHVNDDKFIHKRIKEFKIESETPLLCNIDGESIYDYKYNFEILENKIVYFNETNPKIKKIIHDIK